MKQFFERPKFRADVKEVMEYDVTRLTFWASVRVLPFIILFGLLMASAAEKFPQLTKWNDHIAWVLWGSVALIPIGTGVVYYIFRRRMDLTDCKDSFPRFHTISFFTAFVQASGVFTVISIIALAASNRDFNGTEWGYAGLFFAVVTICIMFAVSSRMEKKEAPADINSARQSSWTPETELERENELKRELANIEQRLNELSELRWTFPCGKCSKTKKGKLGGAEIEELAETQDDLPEEDDVPPVIKQCSTPDCRDGKLEWASAGQKQAFEGYIKQKDLIIQELKSIGAATEYPFAEKYLEEVRFKWFTGQGVAEGDLIPGIRFEASEERLRKYREKNVRNFTEWANLKGGSDPSFRYVENIAQWGKKYIVDEAKSEDSRELKTLSYNLYRIAKENSLSELQQVELCAAAVRSLVKNKEEVVHPPIPVPVYAERSSAEEPKMDRVKSCLSLLWQVASMYKEEMSRAEKELLNEKARSWFDRTQLLDDDDPAGSVQDCFSYIDELEAWYWNTSEGNENELRLDDLAVQALTHKEHQDLLADMKAINELNASRNVAKYNEKLDLIEAYEVKFGQTDLMNAEQQEFEVSHYPKYPTETLVDGEGTIDDGAILLAALLYDCGYRVTLFRSIRTDIEAGEMEYMGVAVGIEGSEDERYFPASNSHKGMIYIEASSEQLLVCEKPIEKISGSGIKLIAVS